MVLTCRREHLRAWQGRFYPILKLRSSLSLKVLVLVALPLLVQWGCLFWLYNLQLSAERAVQKSLHSRDVAEAITHLRIDMYRVVSDASMPKGEVVDEQRAKNLFIALQSDYTNLLALTRGDSPELRAEILNSQREMVAAWNGLLEIKKSLQTDPDSDYIRKPMWIEMRRHMNFVLRHDFGRERERQDSLVRLTPAIRAELRKQQLNVMVGLALASLVLTAVSAVFLVRGITSRISKVSDNAYRLAAGRTLNEALSGSDEIAGLDRAFRDMAGALREASRKERAVVVNARDFICSLSTQLKFTAANPACERMLGREERDLIGQSLLSFVPKGEGERVRLFFDGLKKQAQSDGVDSESVLETRLWRKDGEGKNVAEVEAELSAHWSAEEDAFFVVAHDISDRKQAEALKQEVVVMVTHDLRTPLATLQNILKFLRSGNFGNLDQKGKEYVSVANRNVERMSNLVNDLLDIEKVKSGLMTLDKQEVDLVDCFTAARELAGAFADEAGVKIQCVANDFVVLADQDRLTRVLANLIANAIKFSPSGGTVTVAARSVQNEIQVAVTDQGPGIPADQIEKIFERFRQVEDSQHKGKGGSGLGLTICQAIVELHGGKIWAENLPEGGTRFVFSLPL